MAHWAELDENNVVLRITVGNNDEPDNGYQWLIDNLGGTWVDGASAGVGMIYDSVNNVFVAPELPTE